jgi:hypothetical protein
MNHRVGAVIISGLILALVFLAPTIVRGDEWNLATRFTINQQFEVPGAILEANTPYVIRLHDSPSTRNVVQIFNEDQSRLLAMFIAIRDERMEPTDDTRFTFMESAPGFPLPIKEWFYPGRLSGLEFLYSKDQLERIAGYRTSATTQVAQVQPAPEPEPVVEPEPAPEIAEVAPEPEPAPVEEPVEAESEIAQAEPPQQEEPVVEEPVEEPVQSASDELPRTAGELPMLGLLGLIALGAGLGLRVLSAKS